MLITAEGGGGANVRTGKNQCFIVFANGVLYRNGICNEGKGGV